MNELGESWAPAMSSGWMQYRYSCSEVLCDALPGISSLSDGWDLEMQLLLDSLRLELGP